MAPSGGKNRTTNHNAPFQISTNQELTQNLLIFYPSKRHILLRSVQEVCSGLPPIDQSFEAFWAVMAKWTTSAGQYLFTTLTKLTKLYIGIVDSERAFSVVNKLITELPMKTTAYRLSVSVNSHHPLQWYA